MQFSRSMHVVGRLPVLASKVTDVHPAVSYVDRAMNEVADWQLALPKRGIDPSVNFVESRSLEPSIVIDS